MNTQMNSEISVKIVFNDEMRRFSFTGTSYDALKTHIVGLLGLPNPDSVILKYADEDGDLITLSSDLELKTAIVPDKVLRLQVVLKNAPPAAEPMDVQREVPPPNPFSAFGVGCGGPPAHAPPGFFGPPQHPFPHHEPHHGFPHEPHHGPHHGFPHGGPYPRPCGGRHEWAKFKEENKKAKKTLSKDEYAKYKEEHKQEKKAFKEAFKAMKAFRKGKHHEHGRGGPFRGRGGAFFGRGGHGPFHGHGRGGFPPHHHMGMPFPPPPFAPTADGPTPPPAEFTPGGLYPQIHTPFGQPGFGFGRGFGHGFGCEQDGVKLVARHVKDVTVEDGMQIPPNTPFTKTWRVRNEGPAWPAGCRLTFVSKRCGDNLGGPEFVTVEGAVEPTQEIDISVNLISPNNPGRYTGFWKLTTPDGRKFGQRMWVSIVVPSLGSSSSDEDARLADRYEVLVDSVLALGFTAKRHRVFRLLQKYDGNVEQVANVLAEKSQRKAEKVDRTRRD